MTIGKSHALIVLPPLAADSVQDRGTGRWLARASVRRQQAPASDLDRLLNELGLERPVSGLAALRLWGQTGERPDDWIAAADPVFLEARLDRVHLHALPENDLPDKDLGPLYDDLGRELPEDAGHAVRRVGHCGYLVRDAAIAAAALPPAAIDGFRLDDFLPAGDAAEYLALVGEIQTMLHHHPVNAARQERGRLPVNSLWIWGGGHVPEPLAAKLPMLFSDEPLSRGYWHGADAPCEGWPGTITDCVDASGRGFAAVVPEADAPMLGHHLRELLKLHRRRILSRITLVFRNGIVVERRRWHALRVWRRYQRVMAGVQA
ncbi:MAG: hypothetical protein WD078_06250 [Woeseia sp.]